MNSMPIINLDAANLTKEEQELAKGIVNPRTGALRATKPQVKVIDHGIDPDDPNGYYHIYTHEGGRTAYIWRHVAFMVSPRRQHQCMPTLDFCDLDGTMEEIREESAKLRNIADRIVETVPAEQQHGLHRWARAFGYA